MRTTLVATATFLLTACSVCLPVAPTSSNLCTTSTGGLGLTLFGGNEQYSSLVCAATHDGGMLSLTVTGTQCALTTTAPVHAEASADCNVSTVPAGTYTVTLPAGSPTTLTLPLAADAGLADCVKQL